MTIWIGFNWPRTECSVLMHIWRLEVLTVVYTKIMSSGMWHPKVLYVCTTT